MRLDQAVKHAGFAGRNGDSRRGFRDAPTEAANFPAVVIALIPSLDPASRGQRLKYFFFFRDDPVSQFALFAMF
ncbi:hypothetical protein LAD77_00460 [Klebsiella pneumoniae]|nr:hypothetical protein [Klebsiella pneumoniae]